MEEIFKDIRGYEGLYKVSNLGNVISYYGSKKTQKARKPITQKYGYHQLNLKKNGQLKMFLVHRLVAIAFIPNPKNLPQVNHINGIKTDNRVENLEWCTAKQNTLHSYKAKLRKSSTGTSRRFLSPTEVAQARKMLGNIPVTHIARQLNTSRQSIYRLKN